MSATVTDPVCGMKIDPSHAPALARHGGVTYFFCADSCRKTFDKDPASFVSNPEEEDEEESGQCCHNSCGTA